MKAPRRKTALPYKTGLVRSPEGHNADSICYAMRVEESSKSEGSRVMREIGLYSA